MPFHTSLLGKDRLALYSFIHSLNTNFGTAIFEPVALELAKGRFASAKSQVKTGQMISAAAQDEIQKIINKLREGSAKPDKPAEIAAIRKVCQKGEMRSVKSTKVDLRLENNGEIYLLDLKTAKPNMAGFIDLKRTLLEWVAKVLAENPDAQINTLNRHSIQPLRARKVHPLDNGRHARFQARVKGGGRVLGLPRREGAYDGLLECFERAGIEMRDEIDAFFSKFKAR